MANATDSDTLTALWAIAQAVEGTSDDVDHAVEAALAVLSDSLGWGPCVAHLADRDGEAPRLAAQVGLATDEVERLADLPNPSAFLTAAGPSGRCFRLADVEAIAEGSSHLAPSLPPEATWCIPLRGAERSIGQLTLRVPAAAGDDTERLQPLCSIVGRLVSAAVERARRARADRGGGAQLVDRLLDALPLPVYCKDTAGVYLTCNRAFAELVGAPRSEIVGRTVFDIAPPAQAEAWDRDDRSIFAAPGAPLVRDGEALISGGGVRRLRLHKAALRSARGEVEGLVGAVLDTTELERHERLLRLNERRLGAIVELNEMSDAPLDDVLQFALDAVTVLTDSPVGMIGFVHEELKEVEVLFSSEAMEGCSARETRSLPLGDESGIWAEAIRQRRPSVVNDYSTSRPGAKGLPPGHIALDRFLGVPVVADGSVRLLIGLGNKESDYNESDAAQARLLGDALWNLLERRRRGEAVRRSEERLRMLLQRLPTGVFLVDPSTHTITDANPAAARLIGLPPEEIIGRVCHEFICPTAVGDCPVTDQGLDIDNSERVLVCADGTRLPIMKTVVTIDQDRRQLLLEAFVNVAELKWAQQALEASEAETRELAGKLQTENDRLNRDMTLAAAVQRSAVPERVCVEGLCSAFHFRPSGSIGGDFLGYIRERDGTGLVYVGDVSGHGLPSAVAVTAIVGWIQDVAEPGISPSEFLEALQESALSGLEAVGLYATLCVGRFDSASGEFRYASAGHPLPLRLGTDGSELVEGETGAPLGLLPDFYYPEQTARLAPGEGLLLYSDGLLDALDSCGERIGIERVSRWCGEARGGTPCGTLDKVIGAWNRELGACVPDDDVTALALHRVAMSQWLVESGDELPTDAVHDLAARADAAGFSARETARVADAVRLALDLAYKSTNVAHSARIAYGSSPGCFHAVASLNDRRRPPSFGHARRTPPPPPEATELIARLRSLVSYVEWRPTVGDVFLATTCAPPT